MRSTSRLCAEAARFLTPFSATGLTGLRTHPSPRPELRLIYSKTLDALSQLPTSSVYRTATENLTRSRLAIVSAAVPQEYDSWKKRRDVMVKENMDDPGRGATILKANGETFVEFNTVDARDQDESDEGGPDYDELPEGPRTIEERVMEVEKLAEADVREVDKIVAWEPEPPLTTDQINDIETKINGGLIEEVIQVARGELDLVRTMKEHQVWEPLVEKPGEGQWVYFGSNKEQASA